MRTAVPVSSVQVPPDPAITSAIGRHHSLETAIADLVDGVTKLDKVEYGDSAQAETVRKMLDGREIEEVQLDGMRRTIAARLSEAKQTIPHFYLRRSAKLDALMEFRGTLNTQLEARKVKLSVNDFIIKACALALQQVPDANAVWAGDRIIKLKPSDVAVAVAVEGGLFTPVLKDADKKTLSALSAEMKDLATRAKTKKLAPHEYQGGSFAISNLGMFGIENFDAVINPPHGAILAVGAGIQTPVVENGEIVIRNVMSMTLSVDHRVIDGALGAQLVHHVVEGDVLIVLALFRLGGRGEDGLGQAGSLHEAIWQLDATHGAIGLVLLQTGAGEKAAGHTLEGQHVQFLDYHRAAEALGRDALIIERAGQVVGKIDGIEEELRGRGQHATFIRDGRL
mgnify:CR=1 FL=1